MKCPNCGHEFEEEIRVPSYCEDCGTVYDASKIPPMQPCPKCFGKIKMGAAKKGGR